MKPTRSHALVILTLVFAVLFLGASGLALAQDPTPPTAGSPSAEPLAPAAALGTSFTYQGRLNDGGNAANGAYDLQFKLFDAASGGTQIGGMVSKNDLAVSGGLFTTDLDFGAGAFDGQARWLEVWVRSGASTGSHTRLDPRRALLASPYATYSSNTRGLTVADNNYIGIGDFANGNWLHPRPLTPLHILSGAENPALTLNLAGLNDGRYATGLGVRHVLSVGTFLDFYAGDSGNNAAPLTAAQRRMTLDPRGWLGIGTSSPQDVLHLVGRGKDFILGFNGGEVDLTTHMSDMWISTSSPNDVVINPLGFNTGKVGIGTSTPQAQLHVQGQSDRGIMVTAPGKSTQVMLHVADTGGNDYGYLSLGGNTELRGGDTLSTFTGRVAIGTHASDPNSKLDVGGIVRTDILQIDAGADLAERFQQSGDTAAEPGTVMVIDTAHPGHLQISEAAYDTKVAGIVSGAGEIRPGLTLSQEGVVEGDLTVALAGRVYARCEAISSPIQPGDLLTTSDVPGHCMKAVDKERRDGAMLGKAMTGLTEGTGLVLVLVNLQ